VQLPCSLLCHGKSGGRWVSCCFCRHLLGGRVTRGCVTALLVIMMWQKWQSLLITVIWQKWWKVGATVFSLLKTVAQWMLQTRQAAMAWRRLITVMEQPFVLSHLILSTIPLPSYQMNYLLEFGIYVSVHNALPTPFLI